MEMLLLACCTESSGWIDIAHRTLQSYIDTEGLDAWNKNPNPLKIKNRTVEGIIAWEKQSGIS